MSILNFILRNRNKSAQSAKERLQIVVSHQRNNQEKADFIPQLREELIEVIKKYTHIEADGISVNLQKNNELSVLELNITLGN